MLQGLKSYDTSRSSRVQKLRGVEMENTLIPTISPLFNSSDLKSAPRKEANGLRSSIPISTIEMMTSLQRLGTEDETTQRGKTGTVRKSRSSIEGKFRWKDIPRELKSSTNECPALVDMESGTASEGLKNRSTRITSVDGCDALPMQDAIETFGRVKRLELVVDGIYFMMPYGCIV